MIKWIKDKIIYLFFGGLILAGAILLLNTPPLGGDLLTPTESVLSKIDATVIPVDKIHTSNGELKVEHTDDNFNETFIIKSDREVYGGGNFDMIMSVTNLRAEEEGTLKLKYSKGETINSVSKYIPVNSTRDVPIFSDVEVKCGVASSSPCYENIQTGTETQDIIIDSWEEITLINKVEKTSLLQKETIGEYDDREIKYLFTKGTTFLKVNISYEDNSNFTDKFYIEIFGEDGGYGLLDPVISDNFDSYTDGDLNGQGSWSGGTTFDIQGSVVQGGTKAVVNTGSAAEEVTKAFSSGVATGSQFFYIRKTGTNSDDATVRMSEGGSRKIIFGYRNTIGDTFAYYSGTAYTDTGVTFADDTWYKVEIQWRSSDKKARYYVDNVLAQDWDNTITAFTTDIDGIIFRVESGAGTFYFDTLDATDPSPPSDRRIIQIE